MSRRWFSLVLALGLCVPAFAQKAAPEKITKGPVVEGVGDSWAVIAWTTNTGGSSVVRYGTDQNSLSQTAQSAYSDNEKAAAQNHRVKLTNLKPGTTYYFAAVSAQGEGTGTEAKSAISKFTTKGQAAAAAKGEPVKITDGPRVEGVGSTWAVIAWTTNTGGSTTVRYGTDANSLTQTAQAPYSDNEKMKAQNHRVRLKNLKPNTKYFFIADSGQGEDTGTEAKSSVGQFTTKAK
jgi:phosphodiesterase/alkaline phosphatase D-like protein